MRLPCHGFMWGRHAEIARHCQAGILFPSRIFIMTKPSFQENAFYVNSCFIFTS